MLKAGVLEKVNFEADNIISKKYYIKENLLVAGGIFKEILYELKMCIGVIVLKTIQNKKIQDLLLNKLSRDIEREAILSDFDNYTLVMKKI